MNTTTTGPQNAQAADAPVLLEEHPHPGVVLLRLHRPAALNALNLQLRRALAEAFLRLDADPEVRVIVLAGSAKAFCAGADLTEYRDADPLEIMSRRMDLLWDAIGKCSKPVVAAVRGWALGGGCEVAMHADILIAERSAKFGQPEVKVGIMPGGGATQRLTRAVGKFRAMNILMRGEPFSGEEALAWGLASELAEDGQAETRALTLARELCELPPLALRQIKASVLQGMNVGLDAGLAFERSAFATVFASEDKREGMAARLEKRAAKFQGR